MTRLNSAALVKTLDGAIERIAALEAENAKLREWVKERLARHDYLFGANCTEAGIGLRISHHVTCAHPPESKK